MADPKPKYVRLTRPEIDSVISAFEYPLAEAAAQAYKDAIVEPGKAIYEAAFPEEVRKAFKVLSKHNLTKGRTQIYVNSSTGSAVHVDLGGTYQIVDLDYHNRPVVSKELISAVESHEKAKDAALEAIQKAKDSLRSAARACRTRYEFGQVWPQLTELMGADWVTAQIDGTPSSLPVVINLDAATALAATIKKAA